MKQARRIRDIKKIMENILRELIGRARCSQKNLEEHSC